MLEITLLRHVKVAGAAALYGHTDVAAKEEENRRVLAAFSATKSLISDEQDYDLVISSPLQRCRLLAEQLSRQMQCPHQVLAAFQEMSFGLLDGVPFDHLAGVNGPAEQAEKNWSLLEAFWQSPAEVCLPEAESLLDFHYRVTQAWSQLVNFYSQEQHKSVKRILLITHGGVIRMILAYILQLDWRKGSWYQHLQISYASCSKVTIDNQSVLHTNVNYIGLPLLKY